MKIREHYITLGSPNRPGRKLKDVRALVVHWIGAPQTRAQVIRNNFEKLHYVTDAKTGKKVIAGGKQGATQYVIDWDTGEIIRTMPETEVTHHVGTTGTYTDLKRTICGAENPNNYMVGIECCIGDKSITGWEKSRTIGKPSDTQYAALVAFAADFCTRHKLDAQTRLLRHYDVTGKRCHVYFVANPDAWQQFKNDVEEAMQVRYKTIADVPAWARDAVQARIKSGALKGDPVKGLNLTEDMARLMVIEDRHRAKT